jgi:hypothetical protein
MACVVFFLGRLHGLLHGPQVADLPIDINLLTRQGLEPAELSDLTFRLTDGCGRRQTLCNCFSVDFLGELQVRAVSGVMRFGAMAGETARAPGRTGERTWLEVAKFGNLPEQLGSVVDKRR